MKNKKMKIIIIVISIILVILIGAAILYLYLNTEVFKSNRELFTKYIAKNTENFEEYLSDITNNGLGQQIKNSKYKSNTDININYTENIGTTAESKTNVINNLKVSMEGQIDNTNNYQYQNIKLKKENENLAQIEYLQENEEYSIRLTDLFNQYISVENSNLNEVIEKLNLSEEQKETIPLDENETVNFYNIINSIKFSEEEKEQLSKKYIDILKEKLAENNFSKQENSTITIDDKKVYANSYVATLTVEQLNDLYLNVLETLKEDNIIFNKIPNDDIKNNIKKNIEELIRNINKNNIGKENVKIIVYENQKNTVRTLIQGENYNISLDWLKEDNEKYVKLSYNNENTEVSFIYRKESDGWNCELLNKNGENTNIFKITQKLKNIEKGYERNSIISYQKNNVKIEINGQEKIEPVTEFEKNEEFSKENKININSLNKDQILQLMEILQKGINNKFEQIKSVVSEEEIRKALSGLGFTYEAPSIGTSDTSATEITRFNSQFEILKGENLDGEKIITTLDAIKNNLYDFEVISNTQLRIILNKDSKNEEKATILTNFMEKNKSRKYNVELEYDETTGFVKNIILSIVEKKNN